MKQELQQSIAAIVKQVFKIDVVVELSRPPEQFGDFATNVALQIAGRLSRQPAAIAEELCSKLGTSLNDQVSQITVAGPGFINLTLTDKTLIQTMQSNLALPYVNQEILVEFGDANPFKSMHLGHLYTAIVGDAIARLLVAGGASVKRLSYHGDVGMHVAKAVWAIQQHLKAGQDPAEYLKGKDIGIYYVEGAKAYQDGAAEDAIKQINAHIYARDDEQINAIYDAGRDISFQSFDKIFDELGISYTKRYLESQSSSVGLDFVRHNIGKVFEASDGAIVYKGEKNGLHTRVFINSLELPTYETKDLGLAELKSQDFPEAKKSIVITANEQTEYFRVMLAALGEIDTNLAAKTQHISHGFLSLSTGKMSSRTGEVLTADSLLRDVQQAIAKQFPESSVQTDVYLAAVKYSFLNHRIGSDIVFNVQQSVALEGNSGPYLQYSYARARSLLQKAVVEDTEFNNLSDGERSLVRKLAGYSDVLEVAAAELMPHYICVYLYELAQTFNRFYEHNRVIGDSRQSLRLNLVQQYADRLKAGLQLLGIAAPESM